MFLFSPWQHWRSAYFQYGNNAKILAEKDQAKMLLELEKEKKIREQFVTLMTHDLFLPHQRLIVNDYTPGGWGLGLTLVKGIVEELGGNIVLNL